MIKQHKIRANMLEVILLTALLVLIISLAWHGIEYIILGDFEPSLVDDYVALMIYFIVFFLVYRLSVYRQTLIYIDLQLKRTQIELLIEELDEKKYSYLFRKLKKLEKEYQQQFRKLPETQRDYVEFRDTSLKAKKRIAYYQEYFKENLRQRVLHGSRREKRLMEEKSTKRIAPPKDGYQ